MFYFLPKEKKYFSCLKKYPKKSFLIITKKMLSFKQKFLYFSEKLISYTFRKKLTFFISDVFRLGSAIFYFTKILRVLTKNISHSALVKWFCFSMFYVFSILKQPLFFMVKKIFKSFPTIFLLFVLLP